MLYNIICYDKLTGEIQHTFNPQPLDKCRKAVEYFIRLDARAGNFGRYEYLIESETIPITETLRYLRNTIIGSLPDKYGCQIVREMSIDLKRKIKQKQKHRNDILLTILSGSLFGLFVTIGILSAL